jgi:hypothetical protein
MRVDIYATTPSRCGLRGGRKEGADQANAVRGVVTSALPWQRPGARAAEFFRGRCAREIIQVYEAT